MDAVTTANSAWETRITDIMPYIDNNDSKTSVVLIIMQRTSIPWSEQLQNLITEVTDCIFDKILTIKAFTNRQSKHFETLKEQYQLLKFKKMLLKYGLQDINTSDISCGRSTYYLQFVCFTIRIGQFYISTNGSARCHD